MENPQYVTLLLVAFMVWSAQETAEAGSSEMSTNRSKPVLNMAHYSLDDKYEGCLVSMQNHLTSLIQTELNMSEIYQEAWEEALYEWQENRSWLYPRNMEELSEVAIWAYTLEYPSLYSEFNAATRTAGKGPAEYEVYPFKSLHFLLTQATLSFRRKDHKCVKVYRGTDVKFSINDLFRFGQFTSTSENSKVAEFFAAVTFFKLFTCNGIEISEISYHPGEEEVLVPPYEIFKVTSVEKTSDGKTVEAKSVGTCSYHNCAFVGEGWDSNNTCPEHQGNQEASAQFKYTFQEGKSTPGGLRAGGVFVRSHHPSDLR